MGAPELRRADGVIRPSGEWTLAALGPSAARMRRALAHAGPGRWELDGIARLDSFGALLLWRAWGGRLPEALELPEAFETTFARLASTPEARPRRTRFGPLDALAALGGMAMRFASHATDFIAMIGRLALDVAYLFVRPRDWPFKEFSANLHKVGVRAMPVCALVGFLIGVVLSYLSALQLKAFGADIYIVNILGLGIIRELGPVLVAVLVAGRSGSAMTAQLGVMRVTEEIDALAVMGISRYVRLVLPKVMALTCAMPLLVLWTSSMALLGGMMSAQWQLGLSSGFFIETLPKVVPQANLYIGFAKGTVFGLLVALIACHYGLRVKPNTESLSANTTASVVAAITTVILADAVFAIATRNIGLPI